jgi:hypothetical protein
MSAPTFIQTLRQEVALLQAQYPDRADEVSRACALIAMGYVVDQGDGNGQVLSSDGKRYYTVNGQCECSAAHHGRHCKHLSAWRLFKHVQKKVEAQTAPAPEDVLAGKNISPLPEAPASVNLRVMVQGYEVMVTLRDRDEATLVTRLQTFLRRQDVKPVPKPAPRSSGNWKRGTQGR